MTIGRGRNRDIPGYGEIQLFAGTASCELAEKISGYLDIPLSGRDIIEFPNENLMAKLHQSVRGQDVYVIQTTSRPVHRNLMELLILLQTMRLDSAARITAVVPYLTYARSDKKDQPRVPITARLVTDMIEIAGADRYITLDLHAGQLQGFFSIPGDVLTAFHIIKNYLFELKNKLIDPVVVTTDLGFAKKGRNIAEQLDVPLAFIEKRRAANDAKAKAVTIIGNVTGRDVILVDDEIDTGRTVVEAVDILKEHGAHDIYLTAVHPIMSLDSAKNLAALPLTELITTDTVPIPEDKQALFGGRLKILSIASLLGEVIKRAHEGRSVGEMFNE